jgi:hypothetical protein
MPASAIRRRWPLVAASSKLPSASNGVMLMTKVLAREASGEATFDPGNDQLVPALENLNSLSALPAKMACFSSRGTSEKVALIVFHEYGQSVVMCG